MPSDSKCQVVAAVICVLLTAAAIRTAATTCVVVVVPTAIVTAIDTRETTLLFNGSSFSLHGVKRKAFLVRRRFAVADIGLEGLTHPSAAGDVSLFDFPTWLRRTEQKLPRNVSIAGLFQVIKDESHRDFAQLGVPAFYNPRPPKDESTNVTNLVQFVVVGYASQIPEVLQVQYKIDWNHWQLVGPIQTIIHPADGTPVDRDLAVFGEFDSVRDYSDPKSEAHRRLMALIPRELPKIIAGKALTVHEAIRTAGAIIRLETEDDPPHVAFPIEVITIPQSGTARVAFYDDKATALTEPRD
ncbi:MAG: hypothetical protein ACRD3D_10790 [Terriglobia bacterium]